MAVAAAAVELRRTGSPEHKQTEAVVALKCRIVAAVVAGPLRRPFARGVRVELRSTAVLVKGAAGVVQR